MNKHAHPFRIRLRFKFYAVLLLALALSCSVYLLVYEGGVSWVLYGPPFAPMWQERLQAEVDSFQTYVEEQGLSSQDSAAIQSWQKEHPAVYLFLDDFEVLMEDGSGYTVTFSDGAMCVSAYISDTYYSFAGWMLAMGLAAVCFLLVMLPFVGRLLRRLTRLSREMEVLTAGDLEHEIAVEGQDELSALGEHIDRLRRSVLERIQREQSAVQANRELVTSLSHDLRTPLTKQIGYLEILQRHLYRDEAERQDYQERVWKKAMQMKDLSDRLFQHFQAGGEAVRPLEVLPGHELLGQILEEQVYDLKGQGMAVDLPAFPTEFLLEAAPEEILRVFDNLFSNLKKYAVPNSRIAISVFETEQEVHICMENHIQQPPPPVESHRIGLNTVRMLLARNHGRIETLQSGDRYRADVTFLKYTRP